MRPVQRPVYTGEPVENDYKKYLKPLIDAFGGYCSYCEREDKLDVEHVVPKSKAPGMELDWNNLLLGCPRCNRDFKKSQNDNRYNHVWPDADNTFDLMRYFKDGRVKPAENLSGEVRTAVENTIKLVCLDDSRNPQKPLSLGRRRAFKMAESAKQRYLQGNETLDEVIDEASAGYWSVWYTVFKDIDAVATRLIGDEQFPNTKVTR